MLAGQLLQIMVLAVGAVDAEELAKIRAPLESYLARIEAVHIRYVERWEAGPKFARARESRRLPEPPSGASPELARRYEELRKKTEALGPPTTTSTHDLLDLFPSSRHRVQTKRTHANGEVNVQDSERYVHEGTLIALNTQNKQASIKPVGRGSLPLRSPLNAVGYRLPVTLNMRASELLAFPDITEIMPAEKIGEFSTLVVKVGPRLPQSVRNNAVANDEMWYQLWLDPARENLPIRMDVYVENQYEGKSGFGKDQGILLHRLRGSDGREREFLRYRTEIQEFMDASDRLRTERLPFPRRASFDDGGGTTLWEVTSVEINPVVTANDFRPVIPDDYTVVENGDTARRPRIHGGDKGRQQRFEEDARKAREAIGQAVPSAPVQAESPLTNRTAWAAGIALAITLFVLLKLR